MTQEGLGAHLFRDPARVLARLVSGWTGPCLGLARLDPNRKVLLVKDPPELVPEHLVRGATGVAG